MHSTSSIPECEPLPVNSPRFSEYGFFAAQSNFPTLSLYSLSWYELMTAPQTYKTAVMTIEANLGIFDPNAELRKNLGNNALSVQDTFVRQKPKFAAPGVISYATSGEFLIFLMRNLTTLQEFCPK
jgi:hypothetical protein